MATCVHDPESDLYFAWMATRRDPPAEPSAPNTNNHESFDIRDVYPDWSSQEMQTKLRATTARIRDFAHSVHHARWALTGRDWTRVQEIDLDLSVLSDNLTPTMREARALADRSTFTYIFAQLPGDVRSHEPLHRRSGLAEILYSAWDHQNPDAWLDGRYLCGYVNSAAIQQAHLGSPELVQQHLRLCKAVDERLGSSIDDLGSENIPEWAQLSLTPICRAVLLCAEPAPLGDLESAGEMPVILVLTGDNSSMCSGPVTFERLSDVEILAWILPDPQAIRVTLKTAIRFSADIEQRELDSARPASDTCYAQDSNPLFSGHRATRTGGQ